MPADVSDLLVRWSAGDEAAVEPVIAAVYGELRLLTRSTLRRQGTNSVLQPTELVQDVDFLILDDALSRLGAIKSRYAQIAELRFLAGFTIEETAEAVSVLHATIEREWEFARAWLRREIGNGDGAGSCERGSA